MLSLINDYSMSSRNQRKRRNPNPDSTTGSSKHNRARTATTEWTVPMDVPPHREPFSSSEEDVVDLTCERAEPAPVVDLTNNDWLLNSVVEVDEVSPSRLEADRESYVLSSDEEDTHTPTLELLQANSRARATPGTVSCPVCMDAYAEIVESGRLMVSTKCGHLFCSQCMRDSLQRSHTCPTCRKKLNHRQYHPIYI